MQLTSECFVKKLWESDHRVEAWKISRPYIKDESEIKVSNLNSLDLSVQSLDVIGFHFKSTFYFRELISSMRPHALWTQSSRVNPLQESKVAEWATLLTKKCLEDVLSSEIDNSKIDAQRMKLPMGTLTEYTAALDFRSWISFLKFLEQYHPIYFKTYGLEILKNLEREGFNYKESRINPAFKQSTIDRNLKIEDFGSWKYIVASIPVNMRAQLCRHQDIKIDDEFMFIDELEAEALRQDDKIIVNMIVSKNKWEQILGHRRCWIANFELYECFHSLVSEEEYVASLPCECKYLNCPFKTDNESRKRGDDPNTPCPFSYTLNEDRAKIIDTRESKLGPSTGLKIFKKLIKEF